MHPTPLVLIGFPDRDSPRLPIGPDLRRGQTLYTSEVTGENGEKGINIPGVPPEVVFASIFKFL